ncbi:Hsp20 family protein [Microvirga yunnanensis]|uniref:Hsp20 family protein n=1 Tax=Microvirga yunnanensis TaxID=2953740 RepID=UPI00358DBF4C
MSHVRRSYGPFQHSFRLPEGICDTIEASFKSGSLTGVLPKGGEATEEIRIDVKAR